MLQRLRETIAKEQGKLEENHRSHPGAGASPVPGQQVFPGDWLYNESRERRQGDDEVDKDRDHGRRSRYLMSKVESIAENGIDVAKSSSSPSAF